MASYPEFTDLEKALIHFCKSFGDTRGITNLFTPEVGYLVVATGFFGAGLYLSETVMIVTGYLIVIGYRLIEIYRSSIWLPAYGSVFRKFDSAIKDALKELHPERYESADDVER